MFRDLTWLLQQPYIHNTRVYDVIADWPLTVEGHDNQGVWHRNKDCRDKTTAFTTAHTTTTLGEHFASNTICGRCLHMYTALDTPGARAVRPVLKTLVRHATDLRQLHRLTTDTLPTEFTDVPWNVMPLHIPRFRKPELQQTMQQLVAAADSWADTVTERLHADRPSWLYVRYAAEHLNSKKLRSVTEALSLEDKTLRQLSNGVCPHQPDLHTLQKVLDLAHIATADPLVKMVCIPKKTRWLLPHLAEFNGLAVIELPQRFVDVETGVDSHSGYDIAQLPADCGPVTDTMVQQHITAAFDMWSLTGNNAVPYDQAWKAAATALCC